MNYINKFDTTEAYEAAKEELSTLEHFIAYDAEANEIQLAPKPNFIIATAMYDGVIMSKYNETGGTETITLDQGENKINNIDYGWWLGSGGIESFDFSNYNTSKVTNMGSMFSYCYNLTSLDLSNFDTSKVTNMNGMFSYCSSLTSLDVSNFDTSQVTHMNNMFITCFSLTSLDVSSFDTSQVTNMGNMFYSCDKLTSLDLSNFDTSKVTNMGGYVY